MIKRIFITLFVTAANVILIAAIWQTIRFGLSPGRIGLLLTAGMIVLYFGYQYAVGTPRNAAGLTVWTYIGAAGVITTFAGLTRPPGDRWFDALAAAALWAGWWAYVHWYSRLARPETPDIEVGRLLPAFQLQDVGGDPFDSATLRGRPTLIFFYRGNWCPFCVAQIREIAADYESLASRGVEVVFISPQPQAHTRNLAEQMAIPAHFLIDTGNALARRLGLAQAGGVPAGFEVFGYTGETALPTVIILDSAGRVVYLDKTDNYRVRPEPATFFAIIDRLVEPAPPSA